jgi:hypothetical protein
VNPAPPCRRLRVYTYDPSLSTQLDTALVNQAVLCVPWEKLEPGPAGEYLEVVDYDPASGCFYPAIDLDAPELLAQDGLAPSEGNPGFHQQMVYAVVMATICHFEIALGRKALWAPRLARDANGNVRPEPVGKLRVYPHALRDANAYYSPQKKALLFGYFPALLANPGENLPGGLVFTCLSQDVVAHETTHALLDGLHRYFAEPSNPDVQAFHEAFADVVALFQHFTQPEALRHQIAKTRGDLATQNLLAEMAHQFGQALGNHGALRDAIGSYDRATKKWQPHEPNPEDYSRTSEPHDRGAILVAALFDAFLAVYKARSADLIRLATGGTGVLPDGHIHPDLVNRLALEAADTAGHILNMAIRALDYCPPVDITFGEYLRALITGDIDLAPVDPLGYRLAVIEGFRRRGIYPRDVRTLAQDALLWRRPWEPPPPGSPRPPGAPAEPDFKEMIRFLKEDPPEGVLPTLEWQTSGPRQLIEKHNRYFGVKVHDWLGKQDPEVLKTFGIALGKDAPTSIFRNKGQPTFEVHSVRSARRPRQGGGTIVDLVVEITQRRRGYLSPEKQKEVDGLRPADLPSDDPRWDKEYQADFIFRGGCTLLISSETGEPRYCIVKSVFSDARLARQSEFARRGGDNSLRATYSPGTGGKLSAEPFALLHRAQERRNPS